MRTLTDLPMSLASLSYISATQHNAACTQVDWISENVPPVLEVHYQTSPAHALDSQCFLQQAET
jgi:hypothetical protein